MKDEIKEILEELKRRSERYNYCLKNDISFSDEDCQAYLLLDYITNLQEKVNQYENPDDMTLFYMWLDEKAKDKMKQLQKENHRLKELCDKYEEEHSTTFEYWKQLVKEDYKSRNEKAIQREMELSYLCDTPPDEELLNILQGEDKDVKD